MISPINALLTKPTNALFAKAVMLVAVFGKFL